MADIRDYWVLRHLRAEASSHVLVYQKGAVRQSGRGLSLWFFPMTTSLVEIPVDDRELVAPGDRSAKVGHCAFRPKAHVERLRDG